MMFGRNSEVPTDCPSPAPAPESVQVSWDMFTVTSLLCQGPTNCHWPVVTSFLWWSVIGGAAILTTGDWRSRHSGRRREALVYKILPKGSPYKFLLWYILELFLAPIATLYLDFQLPYESTTDPPRPVSQAHSFQFSSS